MKKLALLLTINGLVPIYDNRYLSLITLAYQNNNFFCC